MAEKSSKLQPVRISGYKLVELRVEEMMGDIDPESFKALKVLASDTGTVIGYVEKAWKQEGWWLVDLCLFAGISLGIKVGKEHLEPHELRFTLFPPPPTAWGVAKCLAKITDLGVDEAHDVVTSWLKKYGKG